jgi:predicted NUDIX family NTP pyrophosphohydrolase
VFASNEFEMEWPPRSGKMRRFPEVDRIAYFKLATARRKILPAQRPFIDELVQQLREGTSS